MFDTQNKKYILFGVLSILVFLIGAGLTIWYLSLSKKGDSIKEKQPTYEEIIKSLTAPTSTAKAIQNLTKEEKKIIDSLSTSAKKIPPVSKEVLKSVSAPGAQ